MENQLSTYVLYMILFLQLCCVCTTSAAAVQPGFHSQEEVMILPEYRMSPRTKKWYSWNDIDVTKKWYDWQEMPIAEKRTFAKRRADDKENLLDKFQGPISFFHPSRIEWRFNRF